LVYGWFLFLFRQLPDVWDRLCDVQHVFGREAQELGLRLLTRDWGFQKTSRKFGGNSVNDISLNKYTWLDEFDEYLLILNDDRHMGKV
jgi:hypothetical protein